MHMHLPAPVLILVPSSAEQISELWNDRPGGGRAPPSLCAHAQVPSLTSVLSEVRLLVLDEADNLLDMGFRPTVRARARLPACPHQSARHICVCCHRPCIRYRPLCHCDGRPEPRSGLCGPLFMMHACLLCAAAAADDDHPLLCAPQISKILSGLPPPARRQTYLFSATFPRDVEDLANVAMKRQHV